MHKGSQLEERQADMRRRMNQPRPMTRHRYNQIYYMRVTRKKRHIQRVNISKAQRLYIMMSSAEECG